MESEDDWVKRNDELESSNGLTISRVKREERDDSNPGKVPSVDRVDKRWESE